MVFRNPILTVGKHYVIGSNHLLLLIIDVLDLDVLN